MKILLNNFSYPTISYCGFATVETMILQFFLQALLSIQAFLRPFWLFKSFLRMKVCPSQVTKFELQWESTKGYVTNFKIQVNNFRKVSFGYHFIKEYEQKF